MSDEQKENKGSKPLYKQAWDEYKYKDPNPLFERKELLEIAFEARGRELDSLWQRATFFWVLNAAALTGIGVLLTKTEQYDIAFIVAIFGVITAFSWTLINRSSKYWYGNWEERIKCDATLKAWFQPTQVPGCKWWRYRFSPSKILIATSDVIFSFWILVAVKIGYPLFHGNEFCLNGWFVMFYLVAIVIYITCSSMIHVPSIHDEF